jgi:hypothetical protein
MMADFKRDILRYATFFAAIVIPMMLLQNGFVTGFNNLRSDSPWMNRRAALLSVPSLASLFTLDSRTNVANALPFFDHNKDRRQLDLCLVNLLRMQYWATSLSEKMKDSDGNDELIKVYYLEARLGSKVMVAKSKKIGGGASANVFMLKGLQITDCLDDLQYYVDKASRRKLLLYKDDLIESLASIVEFDGLETTQDPSPRSALTLQMYNPQKATFVRRTLAERIIPLTEDILRLFGPDRKAQSAAFIQEYYPKEALTTTTAETLP